MTDAATGFNAFFGGLAHGVRRKVGSEAQVSLAAVEPGKYRCVIFEHGLTPTILNQNEAMPEVPEMYVGTGSTATEAFDAAMVKFEAKDEEE